MGLPALRTAPPGDYDGPGDAWSPEHLLLASVQACFLFTLRAMARVSKLEFMRLELDASGTVDRKDGVTRFTEIVLLPKLTVAAGTNHDRMLQILEKSEKTCLVSASLATPLRPGERTNAFPASSSTSMAIANVTTINQAVQLIGAVPKGDDRLVGSRPFSRERCRAPS